MHLNFECGAAGKLLWTDSYYSGWRAEANGAPLRLQKIKPCFGQIEIPAGTPALVLKYQPRFLHSGEVLVLIGLLGMAVLFWRFCRSGKVRSLQSLEKSALVQANEIPLSRFCRI